MESKRQKQIAEIVRRIFSDVLREEGFQIYGDALVTVTNVHVSPDLSIAYIYLSVYNRDDKQSVILEMDNHHSRLKLEFGNKARNHLRRIPNIQFKLDDTLDEMYRLNALFDKLRNENQMGETTEEGEDVQS